MLPGRWLPASLSVCQPLAQTKASDSLTAFSLKAEPRTRQRQYLHLSRTSWRPFRTTMAPDAALSSLPSSQPNANL